MKLESWNFSEYAKYPNPGLRSYLDSVVSGDMDIVRTPMGKRYGLQNLVDNWLDRLQPLKSAWPTLYQFEVDKRKKCGPMSCRKPLKYRMEDIKEYYAHVIPKGEIPFKSREAVVQEFSPIKGLRPRSAARTVEEMKTSTNSGLPFFTKRKTVIGDTLPVFLQDGCQLLGPESMAYAIAAVLGWRGQEGGPKPSDVKQRVVWMFPFSINVEELRLYQPLIQACQRAELVPAWKGLDSVCKHITSMFATKGEGDYIISTDFTKFDQHFNQSMQECSMNILQSLMTNSEDSHYWLRQVYPIKYNIDLVISNDTIIKGAHGMGSGSGGTNADETLAHRALQYFASQSVNKPLNPNSMCLGDDGILTYSGIKVEDVIRSYTAIGLDMNEEKQYVSKQDCIYLQRWYHQRYRSNGVCVGVYSTCRALNRLCMQERFYDSELWSNEMVALRQLAILENCKWHPMKEEFVDYVMERDRYRLGLSIPGFFDRIVTLYKEATSAIPDLLGYTQSLDDSMSQSGIKDWWIVKYLSSKYHS